MILRFLISSLTLLVLGNHLSFAWGNKTAQTQASKAIASTLAKPTSKPTNKPITKALRPAPEATSVWPEFIEIAAGKSKLLRLPARLKRVSVGNPHVADIRVINPQEIYLLAKSTGATNIWMWTQNEESQQLQINVTVDVQSIQNKIRQILPEQKNIFVKAVGDTVVLSGSVSSAPKAQAALDITRAFLRLAQGAREAPSNKSNDNGGSTASLADAPNPQQASQSSSDSLPIINLLSYEQAQQVMLEVTVAEISKSLIDELGIQFNLKQSSGNWSFGLNTLLGASSGALLEIINQTKGRALRVDAQKTDGLVKILAEPNLVTLSGQESSFLAGGSVYIPMTNNKGETAMTERDYGVGVVFTPTVLDNGLISLKVQSEVSEIIQNGSPFTTNSEGETTVLPSFSKRRAQTTVELVDGQSIAIAGLIKNNVNHSIEAVPGLGQLPVLGSLFRSSDFRNDNTELMFVITPRLAQPLNAAYRLPTDSYTPPTSLDRHLGGKMEGSDSKAPPSAKKQ